MFSLAFGGWVEYERNRCSLATFLDVRGRDRDNALEYNLVDIRILHREEKWQLS